MNFMKFLKTDFMEYLRVTASVQTNLQTGRTEWKYTQFDWDSVEIILHDYYQYLASKMLPG